MVSMETCIADAINEGNLRLTADSLLSVDPDNLSVEDKHLLRKAKAACFNIRDMCIKEGGEICSRLESAGIEAVFDIPNVENFWPQFHQFNISIRDDDPTEAVSIAMQMGYHSKIPLASAGWEVFRRTKSLITLAKNDDFAMQMVLNWSSKRVRPIFFWPSVADATLIPLSAELWPLAFIVRPFNILLRKMGLLSQPSSMGFFLGTPNQLIPQLLNFADLCRDDVLLDLGCGDGRVVVEAALSYGCKAVGYELDASLCEIARELAARNKVEHLVEIRHVDAALAPVEASTVVFLFLPPKLVARTMPDLLHKLPPGSRIIAHEILPISCTPPPARSLPLIGRSAVTVAHLWIAPA